MPHSKAVLFVDDGKPQIVERYPFLDQGVGADGDVDFACGEGLQRLGANGALLAAGKQRHAYGPALNVEFFEQAAEAAAMLLGQDLGRRHHGSLGAVVDHGPHRIGCDRGLARAHIPLQQPAHRPLAGQISQDRAAGSGLRAGELEGQRLLKRGSGG